MSDTMKERAAVRSLWAGASRCPCLAPGGSPQKNGRPCHCTQCENATTILRALDRMDKNRALSSRRVSADARAFHRQVQEWAVMTAQIIADRECELDMANAYIKDLLVGVENQTESKEPTP